MGLMDLIYKYQGEMFRELIKDFIEDPNKVSKLTEDNDLKIIKLEKNNEKEINQNSDFKLWGKTEGRGGEFKIEVKDDKNISEISITDYFMRLYPYLNWGLKIYGEIENLKGLIQSDDFIDALSKGYLGLKIKRNKKKEKLDAIVYSYQNFKTIREHTMIDYSFSSKMPDINSILDVPKLLEDKKDHFVEDKLKITYSISDLYKTLEKHIKTNPLQYANKININNIKVGEGIYARLSTAFDHENKKSDACKFVMLDYRIGYIYKKSLLGKDTKNNIYAISRDEISNIVGYELNKGIKNKSGIYVVSYEIVDDFDKHANVPAIVNKVYKNNDDITVELLYPFYDSGICNTKVQLDNISKYPLAFLEAHKKYS